MLGTEVAAFQSEMFQIIPRTSKIYHEISRYDTWASSAALRNQQALARIVPSSINFVKMIN